MAAPVDPALLRLVPPVRRLIVRTGAFQALSTVLVMARGVLIGTVAATVITRTALADTPPDSVSWLGDSRIMVLLLILCAVVLAHACVAGVARREQSRAVGASVDKLREATLTALGHRDPREVEEEAGRWRHVLSRGMEDFRPYLSQFLPALIAACISTPAALATIAYFDWVSAVFALVTLPLIPVFMILIGTLTAQHTRRRLEVTAGLGQQLADLVGGAPTLRALRRTEQPQANVSLLGERHTAATLGVLRLAFLSSFALEFIATLSVALVAVSIGLRLVAGNIELLPALVVLIIVPEVFNPVRTVGSSYHAAADGMESAQAALHLIAQPQQMRGGYRELTSGGGISVRGLSISGRDGIRPSNLNLQALPGELVVLAGPNGAGKSSVLLALLGQLPDAAVEGSLALPADISYLPPTPSLLPGTVENNLELWGAQPAHIAAASRQIPLDVPLEREVSATGSGLSAGQRERVGIVRALARPARCFLLDEPTAHLSPALVEDVLRVARSRADEGATVLIASHDPRVLAVADRVYTLEGEDSAHT
ncbi:ABC transporter ATP-binding protein/permease [Corynebacterium flavescens]|uniref:ABC transporter ATP-binding protein/permease n=1 Tax=Corynebacterium flavescens TaxID=28028 RepID=UPI003F9054F9